MASAPAELHPQPPIAKSTWLGRDLFKNPVNILTDAIFFSHTSLCGSCFSRIYKEKRGRAELNCDQHTALYTYGVYEYTIEPQVPTHLSPSDFLRFLFTFTSRDYDVQPSTKFLACLYPSSSHPHHQLTVQTLPNHPDPTGSHPPKWSSATSPSRSSSSYSSSSSRSQDSPYTPSRTMSLSSQRRRKSMKRAPTEGDLR